MNKKTKKKLLAWLPLFFTLITIIGGYIQLQKQISANIDIEFRKNIWEKKYETYSNLNNVIYDLIDYAYINSQKYDSIYLSYTKLYWGATTLIQDEGITILMEKFKDNIEMINNGDSIPKSDLRISAYKLSKELRSSLLKTWE